jgi:hypothetical protein
LVLLIWRNGGATVVVLGVGFVELVAMVEVLVG